MDRVPGAKGLCGDSHRRVWVCTEPIPMPGEQGSGVAGQQVSPSHQGLGLSKGIVGRVERGEPTC